MVTITPGSGDTTGVFAAAYATVNSSGVVTGITVSCGGNSYTVTPTVTIAAPHAGTTATATATIAGGIVTAVSLSSPGNGGTGYGGSTSDLHPITINGTTYPNNGSSNGYPTSYLSLSNANYAIYVDSSNGTVPDQSGIWTFVANESNPLNPMVVTLYASNSAGTTVLVPLYATSGTTTGKTWQWNVPRSGRNSLNIFLCVQGPATGAYALWTLSDEFMAAPTRGTGAAQVVNQATPYAANPNITSMVSSPGVFGACFFRVGGQETDNVVDVADLQPATAFSYAGVGNITAVGIAIRQYQVSEYGVTGLPYPGWQSPHIWTNQNYPGTSAVGGGPSPYAWTPPNNTASNNLNFMGNNGPNGPYGNYCGEVVTASPHGFKTGQIISFVGSPPSVMVYDAATGTNVGPISTYGLSGPAWVTGANTFAFLSSSSLITGSNTQISNVSITATANWKITSPVPSGGNCLPYEVAAAFAAAIPNCGLHTVIPQLVTDACITQIATAVRDNLPVGRQCIFEYTDEHWNLSINESDSFFILSNLCSTGTVGITSYSPDAMYAYRQAQIHQIAVNVFNETDINGNTNRGGSIVWAYGSQWTNAGVTTNIVNFLNTYNTANPGSPFFMHMGLVAHTWTQSQICRLSLPPPVRIRITRAVFNIRAPIPGAWVCFLISGGTMQNMALNSMMVLDTYRHLIRSIFRQGRPQNLNCGDMKDHLKL